MKIGLKAILGITGMSLLAVGVAVDGGVFNFANIALRMSRASDGLNTILNHNNAPTLSGGTGTMSFSNGCAEQVSLNNPNLVNGSPFYIRGKANGTVTVAAYVTVATHDGEHTLDISKELTVN